MNSLIEGEQVRGSFWQEDDEFWVRSHDVAYKERIPLVREFQIKKYQCRGESLSYRKTDNRLSLLTRPLHTSFIFWKSLSGSQTLALRYGGKKRSLPIQASA
jgi:hypothetical protein